MVPATKASPRSTSVSNPPGSPSAPAANPAPNAASTETYAAKNKIRLVTAASLFDGHDAAINVMRRILQASGAEVIHLGHDRSVDEVVNCAIQEDVNAIAMTSYQGGHVEYLKYMHDRLEQEGCGHIRIFAGGGGVILPDEVAELQAYGIERIYSPDDGRAMGLQGMINDLLRRSDFPTGRDVGPREVAAAKTRDPRAIARLISAAENWRDDNLALFDSIRAEAVAVHTPVLGITGTGGAGKSSLVDELVRRFLADFPERTIGIVSVDPSKRKTGGALLGDRIRMNAINDPRVYMRSLATRQANLALSAYVRDAVAILKLAGFELVILETSGIGQSDTEIVDHSDVSLYVMTPEYGAATQLEKIDMLDFADIVALNKFDKRGALDALRDVRKQYQRNHKQFAKTVDQMPVYGTIASQFNDPGTTRLYRAVLDCLNLKCHTSFASSLRVTGEESEKINIIPPERTRYLAEISETVRRYTTTWAEGPECHRAAPAVGERNRGSHRWWRHCRHRQAGRVRAAARRPESRIARTMARNKKGVRRRRVRLSSTGQGHQRAAHLRVALPSAHTESCAAGVSRLGRHSRVDAAGERAGLVPVHGGRLPVQARERRSHAHVRRRRWPRAHEPSIPLRVAGPTRTSSVDGV